MIMFNSGLLMVEGSAGDVIAEGTLILRSIYGKLKEDFGDERANEILVEMGRLAVMDDLSKLGLGEINIK